MNVLVKSAGVLAEKTALLEATYALLLAAAVGNGLEGALGVIALLSPAQLLTFCLLISPMILSTP